MPIKFRCPNCRQAYSIASKKAGTSIRCQKCEAEMRVPVPEPAPDDVTTAQDQQEEHTSARVPPAADGQPDLTAAMRNLLDDDDNEGNDDFVDLSADEIPAGMASVGSGTTAGHEDAVDESQLPGAGSDVSEDTVTGESNTAKDDELAAVLAFEQSLEEDVEPASAESSRLPEQRSGEDDDDDEDEGWGSGRAGDDEEMDLTPMVDVTFLLLVFFMITASFSIQKTLEVPPPNPDQQGASRSETIKDMEENSVLVHIDSRNIISVDDVPLADPSRLADVMRSSRMSEVLITAHENSMHDMLVKVIDASNEVGMQKIRVGITKGFD